MLHLPFRSLRMIDRSASASCTLYDEFLIAAIDPRLRVIDLSALRAISRFN